MRIFLSTAAAVLLAIPALAQQPARPSGVDLVPSTSFAFVTLNVTELKKTEPYKPIREAIAKFDKVEGLIEQQIGVPIDSLDRVTMFLPSVPFNEGSTLPIIVITTREPFNEAKVLRSLKAMPANERMRRRGDFRDRIGEPAIEAKPIARPATSKDAIPSKEPLPPKSFNPDGAQVGDRPPVVKPAAPVADREAASSEGPELYFREERPYSAVLLLDERTIVLLPASDGGMLGLVTQLLRKRADGPLAEALAEAEKHTLVAAARIGPLEELMRMERDLPRELVPFHSLLKAKTVAITADIAAKTTLTAKLTFADAATAKRAEPVLKTLVELGIDTIAELRKKTDQEAELGKVLQPILDLAAGALTKAEVTSDGATLTAKVEAEISPTVAKAMAALPDLIRSAADRMKSSNNLKQIGLACHNYHDTYGYMPSNIVDKDGKPLLSWRVAILPYVEQDNLYRALDLTKAWDDPVNAKLLAQMPSVFQAAGREAEKGKTYFQMPSSPEAIPGGSPFLVPGRKTTFANITDGTSNTIMVVEATEALNWAKPDDLLFDPKKAPKVGDPSRKFFQALFGDGSVRQLRRDKLTDDVLRALMTIDGGEVVTIPD